MPLAIVLTSRALYRKPRKLILRLSHACMPAGKAGCPALPCSSAAHGTLGSMSRPRPPRPSGTSRFDFAGLAPPQQKPQPTGALAITLGMLALMWVQEIADQFLFSQRLDYFGIEPRNTNTWWHIFTASFLHGGFGHLAANTVPFAVLAFLSAVRSVGRFLLATLVISVVAGALVWLLARGKSVHLGASMLIFGYFAYLLGVGWWERTPTAIAVAVGVAALYGGILWGVLPTNSGISFEGHLFGVVGGLVAAWALHR